MFRERKVYAIIGAAGSGKRMAAPLPKQFLKLGDKTILEVTAQKFNMSSYIDEIIIVTAEDYVNLCCQFFHDQKEKIKVVVGGSQRQDSIYKGIQALDDPKPEALVLIHDGARPFVSTQLIDKVVETAAETKAAIAAVPTKDTIRHINEGTLDRSKLYNVQTPQGFQYSLIKEAFDKAFKEEYYGTDDASLVERMGHPIEIVMGEDSNIKITTPTDLKGETNSKGETRMEMRVGSGYDVHKLVEDRKLILGGVDIPYERGLLGHSDADVLIHALMDAILGAAALGDIGKHFPDTKSQYKDISSIELLKHVGKLIRGEGYSLGNADVTIICQKPKLAGYIDEMRANVAKAIGVDKDKISIKATTTEKLGFTGRGEGIAAEAVCLLTR